MKNEELQAKLQALLQAAKDAGLCFTQRDFASLVGSSEQTISSGLKGNGLTDKLLFNIEKNLKAHGVTLQGVNNSGTITAGNNFFTSPDGKKSDNVGRALDMLKTELDRKNEIVYRLLSIIEKK